VTYLHAVVVRLSSLVKKFINTIEPENVKHILATNFKDFGIGERQDAFGALLGQGIFTTGQYISLLECLY